MSHGAIETAHEGANGGRERACLACRRTDRSRAVAWRKEQLIGPYEGRNYVEDNKSCDKWRDDKKERKYVEDNNVINGEMIKWKERK